jgi:DNA modification methylase
MPMKAHENLLVFYKKLPTYNPQMIEGHKPMNYAKNHHKSSVYGNGKSTVNRAGATDRYPRDVLRFPIVNNDDPGKFHQTQKPIELCEYIIKTYTNEDETVLDNCSGSGVVAEACINLNRSFICFEKDAEYWRKSVERIHNI